MKGKFQIQMAFATAFKVLTSGVFLSGLAALMGAGDVLISYISIIMNVCGALILFLSPLLERFKSRKKVTLALTALAKAATSAIVLIPLAVPKALHMHVFIPCILVAFTLQAQAQVSLNNWLVHFVEGEKRGRYISLRMTVELVVTILLSVAAGRVVDSLQAGYLAFALLFGAAFALAALEILTLLRIEDVPAVHETKITYTFQDMIRVPMRNKRFLGFVAYISLFYFILYISDSYTIVFLLNHLRLSYTQITFFQQVFMSLPQLALLSMWGRISDKKGHGFVLHRCIWFFALEVLFFMLTTAETAIIFVPLAFAFASVANAGFNVSNFNRRYELIPEDARILHDNFFSAAVGVALLLGPAAGGALKNLIAGSGIAAIVPLAEFRGLYAIAFIGIIALQLVTMRSNVKEGQA